MTLIRLVLGSYLLIFSPLALSKTNKLICSFEEIKETGAAVKINSWASSIINVGVYYFADINQYFEYGGESFRLSSRYAINNGYFFVELVNVSTRQESHASTYQKQSPQLISRLNKLQAHCYFNKSSERTSAKAEDLFSKLSNSANSFSE
jgi:hypothetical protein